MLPELPERCPSEARGSCRIYLKDWRERPTGPGFPLAVIRCVTHKVYYTLYPPGYAPYGRKPLVLLSPDGGFVERDASQEAFEGTYFQAVLDGAKGFAWPKASLEGSLCSRFLTQVRHINRCCLLLGLARGSPVTVDDVRLHLGLSGSLVAQAGRMMELHAGYQERSRAAYQLLKLLNEDQKTFNGTTILGHLAGLWPKAQDIYASLAGKDAWRNARAWL